MTKKEQKQLKIMELYTKTNKTIDQIKKTLKCGYNLISKTLDKYNIPRKVNGASWNRDEIIWLKQNYQKLGPEKRGIVLKKKTQAAGYMGRKLGLKYEHPDNKIDIVQFINIKKPEVAYLLGIFYADGTIRTGKRAGSLITLTSKTSDAKKIYDLIMKLGDWNFYSYKRKTGWISYFKISSKKLWNFLYEHDYYEKSSRSADKILGKIPDNLKHYFFRGFFDGDGSIRSRNTGCELQFAGSFKQDWTFLIKLLNNMKINFSIRKSKYLTKNGKIYKGSTLVIYNYENCLFLLNYLYQNYNNDKLGLKRKQKIYEKIISKCKKSIKKRHCIKQIFNKNETVYQMVVTDNNKKFIKTLKTEKDAINYKKQTIKINNTKEYRLRNLINYWEFTERFGNQRISNRKF